MPDAHKLHLESVFSYHNRQRLTLFFNLDYEGAQEDDKEEEEESEDDEESLSDDNLKSPSGLLAVPKVQRLFKNFKNLSQLFGKFSAIFRYQCHNHV